MADKIRSYRDLRVWQVGMQLTDRCYRLTRRFPKEELFGLTNQIRRASSRIPANIAEGYGRGHRGEYIQFLRIALGSLYELETHLLTSIRVEVTPDIEQTRSILLLCDEESKMLNSHIDSLGSKP